MKNHKGFVPALLTLGLVLVGSLVTIGISVLTNTNKIASNPRAAGIPTCTTGFYELEGDPEVSGLGCKSVCGDDCQECNWNGDTKWECKTATSKGGNTVSACTKARTYASIKNCKDEHDGDKDNKCSQCLLGQTNRVEYDGKGPPAGGSEKVKNACEKKGGTCNFYADCNYGSYGGDANKYCSDINEKMECCKPKGSDGKSMTNNLCTKASTSNSTNTCVKKTGSISNDVFCRNSGYNGGWSNWTCIEGDPSAVCCSKLNVGGSGGGGANSPPDCTSDQISYGCLGWGEITTKCPPTSSPEIDSYTLLCKLNDGTNQCCRTKGPPPAASSKDCSEYDSENLCIDSCKKENDNSFLCRLNSSTKKFTWCCPPEKNPPSGSGGNTGNQDNPADVCSPIQCPSGQVGKYYKNTNSNWYYVGKETCEEDRATSASDEEVIKKIACFLETTQTVPSNFTTTVKKIGPCLIASSGVLGLLGPLGVSLGNLYCIVINR